MQLDTETIKKDFPIFYEGPPFVNLRRTALRKPLVYLDNAATSQTPRVVLDAMEAYYTDFRANIHRGSYEEGEMASAAYEEARGKVARFIGADPREVIFTSGATASSNMLVSMLEHSISGSSDLPQEGQNFLRYLKSGDEIVTTVMEHHASLIPLQALAKRQGLTLKHLPLGKDSLTIDHAVLEKLITEKTKIVSVMLASNVTGAVNDVARIAECAHKVGALVICDATAAVGHMPVDVKKLSVDFLYFSGHKMCGPTGTGMLWGRGELLEKLEPSVYGGGIVDEVTLEKATWRGVPARFEAGTPNIAGAIGLGVAVEYLEKIGLTNIQEHSAMLVNEAIKQLEKISGVTVYAECDVQNVGVVSFVVDGVHSHDVAEILGREGVAVRAGHHCAMPFITALGVPATTRASFYLYNTMSDIDALVRGIKKAQEVFGVSRV
ncbi:MAG: cysteine desulfurase [Patescibacteria group bacterium]